MSLHPSCSLPLTCIHFTLSSICSDRRGHFRQRTGVASAGSAVFAESRRFRDAILNDHVKRLLTSVKSHKQQSGIYSRGVDSDNQLADGLSCTDLHSHVRTYTLHIHLRTHLRTHAFTFASVRVKMAFMYVCTYVMQLRTHVWTYIRTYVRTYVRTYASSAPTHTDTHSYVHTHTHTHIRTYVRTWKIPRVCVHVRTYVKVCACVQ